MRVLGVDPGLSRCGIGVVDGPPSRPVAVRTGVARTPAGAPTQRRLALLYDQLSAVLADTHPDAVALECVFFNTNVRTAMGVGQAAGVALLCAEQAGVSVAQYTPTQVKAAVAGHGAADKSQVGYMVRALLGLTRVPRPPDAADALALALCHLQQSAATGASGQVSRRLAAALMTATPGAQRARTGRGGAGAGQASGGPQTGDGGARGGGVSQEPQAGGARTGGGGASQEQQTGDGGARGGGASQEPQAGGGRAGGGGASGGGKR